MGKIKHGLSFNPLYNIWHNIKQRCGNSNNDSYHNYGARGIMMHKSWINDPECFIKYIQSLPRYGQPGLTLDRIDNDGNYEPGNLRWAEKHVQLRNRRNINSKSGFIGIFWDKHRKKWLASISVNNKNIFLGRHDFIMEAVEARNEYIIKNKLEGFKIQ